MNSPRSAVAKSVGIIASLADRFIGTVKTTDGDDSRDQTNGGQNVRRSGNEVLTNHIVVIGEQQFEHFRIHFSAHTQGITVDTPREVAVDHDLCNGDGQRAIREHVQSLSSLHMVTLTANDENQASQNRAAVMPESTRRGRRAVLVSAAFALYDCFIRV